MSEIGVKEEVRTANLLIALGYLVRPHIQIYPDESIEKLTDIDVYATKFDVSMNQSILLVECKKDSQRFGDLFKLYGFKKYFGDSQAVYITKDIGPEFRETSNKLGVRVTSFEMLTGIVKQSGDSVEDGYTEDDVANIEVFLKEVRATNKELFWKYHYLWLERDPVHRFYSLQRLFADSLTSGEGRDTKSPSILWFRRELFILALLSAVELSSQCAGVDQKQVNAYIETRFYDVGALKEGKEKISKGVDKLVKQIEKLSGERMDFKGLELIPPYVPELAKVIRRIVNKSKYIQSTLMLDDLIYRKNLHGTSVNVSKLAKSAYQLEDVKAVNESVLRILFEGAIAADFNDFV